jgi:hypothetical protein
MSPVNPRLLTLRGVVHQMREVLPRKKKKLLGVSICTFVKPVVN